MCTKGEGAPQDYVMAHMWYNLAAASGKLPGAAARRDLIAKMMTPDQIAEAQRMAREWKPAY
jgi:TPR repeat protein